TVHMNSWIIVPGGGFDRDSPYEVKSNTQVVIDSLRQYPVLTPSGPNGSPVGFRFGIQLKDAQGRVSGASEGLAYPVVDDLPLRSITAPRAAPRAGKAYGGVRAEAGAGPADERLDHRPGGAVGVADGVDGHMGSVEDDALRSKVLTFYVTPAPVLLTRQSGFFPRPGAVLPRMVGDSLVPGGPSTAFNLPASDDDCFDPRI